MNEQTLQQLNGLQPRTEEARFSRHQLAAVIYRQRQLAARQARVLRPLSALYRYGLQPLRGQGRHWRRLLANLRLQLRPRLNAGVQELRQRLPGQRPSWQRQRPPAGSTSSTAAEPITRLAVGLLTYNNQPAQLQSCLHALEQAILSLGAQCRVQVLVLDNGNSSADALAEWPWLVRLKPAGNVGFGAGHNRLMNQAFKAGAQAYVAMNPDGRAHPRLLQALLECSQRCGGEALVEALQFPCEHPKPFDPEQGDTPWASGACLLLPERIHHRIGGFDDTFFMYCEDVDLSWRARAAGFRVVTAPEALFLHQVSNRPANPGGHALMLAAGVQLARKWRRPGFAAAAQVKLQLLGAVAAALPEQTRAKPQPVPRRDRWAASFEHAFYFARPRW
jgi:hypothetical protein